MERDSVIRARTTDIATLNTRLEESNKEKQKILAEQELANQIKDATRTAQDRALWSVEREATLSRLAADLERLHHEKEQLSLMNTNLGKEKDALNTKLEDKKVKLQSLEEERKRIADETKETLHNSMNSASQKILNIQQTNDALTLEKNNLIRVLTDKTQEFQQKEAHYLAQIAAGKVLMEQNKNSAHQELMNVQRNIKSDRQAAFDYLSKQLGGDVTFDPIAAPEQKAYFEQWKASVMDLVNETSRMSVNTLVINDYNLRQKEKTLNNIQSFLRTFEVNHTAAIAPDELSADQKAFFEHYGHLMDSIHQKEGQLAVLYNSQKELNALNAALNDENIKIMAELRKLGTSKEEIEAQRKNIMTEYSKLAAETTALLSEKEKTVRDLEAKEKAVKDIARELEGNKIQNNANAAELAKLQVELNKANEEKNNAIVLQQSLSDALVTELSKNNEELTSILITDTPEATKEINQVIENRPSVPGVISPDPKTLKNEQISNNTVQSLGLSALELEDYVAWKNYATQNLKLEKNPQLARALGNFLNIFDEHKKSSTPTRRPSALEIAEELEKEFSEEHTSLEKKQKSNKRATGSIKYEEMKELLQEGVKGDDIEKEIRQLVDSYSTSKGNKQKPVDPWGIDSFTRALAQKMASGSFRRTVPKRKEPVDRKPIKSFKKISKKLRPNFPNSAPALNVQ